MNRDMLAPNHLNLIYLLIFVMDTPQRKRERKKDKKGALTRVVQAGK